MDRRSFLLALAGGAAAVPGFAQSPAAGAAVVDVAKVMRFSCQFCLAAESQDKAIAEAVRARGGKFVRAPVPEVANSAGARERVYFAARDIDESFEARIRASLYKASQDAQVVLDSYAQVYYWLEQDLPADYARLPLLFERAQGAAAAAALERSIRLTINAGVEVLPSYVVLVNGRISTTIDKSSSGSESYSALREAVLAAIRSA